MVIKMKSKSKFFWIYSITLFSIAFALIFFSAFTGMRYKEEQTETQALYQGAQRSIISLTNEKEDLEKANAEKEIKIKQQEETIESLTNDVNGQAEERGKYSLAIENLLTVEELLANKKKQEAKDLLGTIDKELLGEKALQMYDKLKGQL